jgi:hypothetical protein
MILLNVRLKFTSISDTNNTEFRVKVTLRILISTFAILSLSACRTAAPQESVVKDSDSQKTYRFVHYNIKELTTEKIIDANNPQVRKAAAILQGLTPDFISINEIQYDKPDVPNHGLPGTGDNMKRLIERALGSASGWQITFGEANTGKNAKKQSDGNYATNPNAPTSRPLADQVNFGTFPGQYSTGFAANSSIQSSIIKSDIKWIDWDASFPFGNHKLSDGSVLENTAPLFDKNFNVSMVKVGDKLVHMITFHTVPAFDFGSGGNLNELRNLAQLEFLEWYLLGTCETANTNSLVRQCNSGIKPLDSNDSFIAVGDLNVDYNDTSPGADVMRRLLTHARIHNMRPVNMDPSFAQDPNTGKSHVTYASDGIDLGKLQANLDYFLVSKDLDLVDLKVPAPLSGFKEESCHPTYNLAKTALDALTTGNDRVAQVSTRYLDNNQRSYCLISATKEYVNFRTGSDHFPVILTFRSGS